MDLLVSAQTGSMEVFCMLVNSELRQRANKGNSQPLLPGILSP